MLQQRTPIDSDTLERARYFPRQVVSPSDLEQDSHYLINKMRRHNRMFHEWGFRLGLHAKLIKKEDAKKLQKSGKLPADIDADTYANSWLQVTKGYALNPVGDEVLLLEDVFINTIEEVGQYLVMHPSECTTIINSSAIPRNGTYYLLVHALQAESRPVRAASNRCGDHPDQFEFSRVKEVVRFSLQPRVVFDPVSNEVDFLLRGACERSYLIMGWATFSNGKIVGGVEESGRDSSLTVSTEPEEVNRKHSLKELNVFQSLSPSQRKALQVLNIEDLAAMTRESFAQAVKQNCNPPPDEALIDRLWNEAQERIRDSNT